MATLGVEVHHDLRQEAGRPEHLVHQQPEPRLLVVVDADEDRAGVGEHVSSRQQPRPHHLTQSPPVTEVVAIGEGVARVVRRVDVDRSTAHGRQRTEHVEVVAVDKGVPDAHVPTVGRAHGPGLTSAADLARALGSCAHQTPDRVHRRGRRCRHRRADGDRHHSGDRRSRPGVTNGASPATLQARRAVQICYTLSRPAYASRKHPVPVIMHSHGWGGSRTTDPAAFEPWLKGRYAVLSFDQRGFGESGGTAQVENPDVEGHDVRALVDLLARQRWVRQDGPGDPRLGAIGGSYGGGYQFLGAFEELRDDGQARLRRAALRDHLERPQHQPRPKGVVRTEWARALSAAAPAHPALPPSVYQPSPRARSPASGRTARCPFPARRTWCSSSRRTGRAGRFLPRPPARHPRALRPGHHRHPVPAPAGPRELPHGHHPRRSRAEHLRRLQRRSRPARRLPDRRERRLRPVQREALRRRLRGAGRALHGRAAQAPGHRAPRLRQAAPRHPGVHVHHRQARHGRHDVRRRHGRDQEAGGAALAYPVAQGPIRIAGRRTSPAPSPRSASTTGRSTASPSAPARSTPLWCRTT